MPRAILDETYIHTAIRSTVADHQRVIVEQVIDAISRNEIVVVGMGFNPFSGKACKALDAIHHKYKYFEYGNYVSMWRERNALKLWTGWPTFPIVFVKGTLIGGATDLQALINSGELNK